MHKTNPPNLLNSRKCVLRAMFVSNMTHRELIIAFYFNFAIAYFQLRKWFLDYFTRRFARPVDKFHHKILIIGDDFASGIGDSFHLGNAGDLSTALHGFIRRSDKVEMRSSVFTTIEKCNESVVRRRYDTPGRLSTLGYHFPKQKTGWRVP